MAIKQRALRKLNTTTNHMLRVMSTESKAAVGGVCQDLEELRDLYREGLPQQDYAIYGEICDGLLLAVQKMMEDGAVDVSGDATALCKELLEYLGTETEKETHFKKEIVFLPYQASMWDSLESVWKAAYEDKEHCNAYVMPIPYADLNPDRSVAAWHCERDQFPKYVPTLDWQEIDLKAWHPDFIFYHNPYDDFNLVTSVESRYYSRNLKECTDKLVYVPYYVTEEPYSVCEAEENTRAGCILTPGVVNADIVVVQSEPVRQIYINVMLKGTSQKDRSYWEQKILALGSPKFDKVLTSKKEDFELPEKWRKLVEGKKVILYNTSLSAMLQNTDKVCDKLRYVFEVFRNREDVILWWRPHPLMKSTFISMRPEYAEEYCNLEKKYIEEGWGIYDDSSDLHRAICWSDAYYGDYSSVTVLYQKTAKPIFRQTFYDNIFVYYGKSVATGDSLWYIPEFYPAIVKLNTVISTVEEIYNLPINFARLSWHATYRNLERVGEKLFAIPMKFDDIIEFDMQNKSFTKIPIPEQILTAEEKIYVEDEFFFYRSMVCEHYIFLYGRAPIIVRFNTSDNSFIVYRDWVKSIQNEMCPDVWIAAIGCRRGKALFFPIYNTKKILEQNIESGAYVLHDLGDNTGNFVDMVYDGTHFWLTSNKNYLVRWNYDNGMIDTFNLPREDEGDGTSFFELPYDLQKQEKLLLVSVHYSRAFVFDKKTGEISDVKYLPDIPRKDMRNIFGSFVPGVGGKSGNVIYFIQPDKQVLINFNSSTEMASYTHIDIKEVYCYLNQKKHLQEKDLSLGIDLLGFRSFLGNPFCPRIGIQDSRSWSTIEACGEKIYGYVLESENA